MNYWVLGTFLLSLGSTAHSQLHSTSDTAQEENGEQCESGTEDVPGHALLASKVVRTIISEDLLLSEKVKRRMETVTETCVAVAKHGSATTEQLQMLFDITHATMTRVVSPAQGGPPVVLFDARANASGNATQPADAAAAATAADKDFVADDTPIFFPPQSGAANVSIMPETREPAEKKHVLALYIVVPIASVFFMVFTISNVMEKFEITAIPESGLMIAVGVILGTVWKMYAHFDFFDDAEAFGQMNSAILNLVLLPIIIFASGWAIRRQDFYSQFPYIMLFAGIGVGLSTVVIACLIHGSGSMGLHGVTRWRTAFAYSALISATDPVATLSTYTKLKVEPLLNIMVFGESIINDAVAIVAFGIFNDDKYMVDESGETLSGPALFGNLIYGVLKIFGGSAILGTGLGAIYTLIAHWADMRHNKKGQILNIFAAAYLTYAIAESVAMSGIIAEMFCALLMGIYMRPHLSTEGSVLATFFVKQVAALADAAVCLLIGFSVVQLTSKGWYFGLWVMLFCLIGRTCAVVPVALLANGIKAMMGKAQDIPKEGWNLLSPQHVFMMWHAGLRGAIALALALELGHWVDVIDGPGTRRALQTATFFLICTFLLLFGGSTSFMLKYMGIETGQDYAPDHLAKTESMGRLRDLLTWLDHKILSPALIGHEHAHDEEEVDVEELLKRFGK